MPLYILPVGELEFSAFGRFTYKDVITSQGTCISEIRPSNAIVRLRKETYV